MSQFLVNLFSHFSWWGYLFGTGIEFTLLILGFLGAGNGKSAENADSEDVQLDIESENELGNKIATYKSMKSGKPTTNTNAPALPINNQAGLAN